jgi:hypothetical protein
MKRTTAGMRRTTLFAGLLVVGGVGAGCLDDSITGTRPVTIVIAPITPTAAVGELVTLSYSVTGTGLLSVDVDWGDGVTETVSLPGLAVEAAGRVAHAYSEADSYDITGTVQAQNGSASGEATVQIN